jgi:hypothetical protein
VSALEQTFSCKSERADNMERREFLAASCATGLASLAGLSTVLGQSDVPRLPGESDARYQARLTRLRAARPGGEPNVPRLPNESDADYEARVARIRTAVVRSRATRRDLIELRRYEIESEAQKAGFDAFAATALVPALNHAGVAPVGVFYPAEGLSPIYMVLRHQSVSLFVSVTQALMLDEEFQRKGAAFLDAPADKPAYKRTSSSLMLAFEGMPQLETPPKDSGRIVQLRTYESPSMKTGLKKIEMFNTAEIAIFRKTGLRPVFFAQTLIGEKMPSLTYMLAFKDMEQSEASWNQFKADPDWKKLRAMPEYDDKKILCGITNLYLKPAEYSQI